MEGPMFIHVRQNMSHRLFCIDIIILFLVIPCTKFLIWKRLETLENGRDGVITREWPVKEIQLQYIPKHLLDVPSVYFHYGQVGVESMQTQNS